MTQNYYSLITNKGVIKEAQAGHVAGTQINLTEIAVGDSSGSYYNPDPSATSLVNEVYRTNLTSAVLDESNPNQLIIEGVIDEEIGPFYIREVGIYDSDGDLFAIGKYPETYKSNFASGSGKRLYIRMILGFVTTPNVALMLSENINFDPNFQSNLNNTLNLINQTLGNKLEISKNLSDLEDVQQARDNLHLGNASLANTDFLVPTACVLSFSGNAIPNGYLECNGASLSRETYSALFSIIGTIYGFNDSSTFKIPDLRGEFIRGFDGGRNIDAGRLLGTYQSDSFKSHNHSYTALSRWGGNPGGQAPYWCRGDSGGGSATGHMTYNGGSETRPRNIALQYIIKF